MVVQSNRLHGLAMASFVPSRQGPVRVLFSALPGTSDGVPVSVEHSVFNTSLS
jgi:hypothetical protein